MYNYKITCRYKDTKDKDYIVYIMASNTRDAIVKAIDFYGLNDTRHELISCEMVSYPKSPLTIL